MACRLPERNDDGPGIPMTTVAQARRIFLEQPQAEEKAHMGHPDFRVGGRIFATLWPDLNVAVVRLAIADQAGALQMSPEALTLKFWGKSPYLEVNLARANVGLMRALAQAAWRNTAPKKLLQRR
jgi:hypothetical protein